MPWAINLLLLLLLLLAGCAPTAPPAPTPVALATPVVVATPAPSPIGFGSLHKLDEHFRKHGREFGSPTREDYLMRAQQLRDMPLSDQVLEARRPDGVVTRFDRQSGAFLAFTSRGIIRTFFKPNDGEAYFQRQLRKPHQ